MTKDHKRLIKRLILAVCQMEDIHMEVLKQKSNLWLGDLEQPPTEFREKYEAILKLQHSYYGARNAAVRTAAQLKEELLNGS